MFKQKIYNEFNRQLYKKLISEWNLDVYYQPEFLAIDAKIQGGKYEVFVVTTSESIFVYPYIKFPFYEASHNDRFDIGSPYGYAGPYFTDNLILNLGEKQFLKYISKGCVSEFVRYHYAYSGTFRFITNIENTNNRSIVILNLKQPWEKIWKEEFSSKNRNLSRKLEKQGYNYVVTNEKESLDEFIQMYYSTMKNVSADKFYYFTEEIINELFSTLKDSIFLAKIEKDSITYASALFFISGDTATYYLSARNISKGKIPATNYLLTCTAKYLHNKGYKILNLGGGTSPDKDDSLLKFKLNFSTETMSFYIGKRIHDLEAYNEIVQNWIIHYGQEHYERVKNRLHFYR